MKYVILQTNSKMEYPIIFPDFLEHHVVANSLAEKIISAGHVSASNGNVFTYGQSQSLGLIAREKDAEIISNHLSQ